MSVIPTRDEFERVLVRITIAERGVMLSVATHESEAKQNLAVNHAFELRDQVLAVYDAQAARVAELEAACEAALTEIMEGTDWDEVEQCRTCGTCSTALMLRTVIAKARGGEG